MRLLQSHGIDFSFSWRNFVELYEEIYEKKQSRLEVNFESKFGKHHEIFFFRKKTSPGGSVLEELQMSCAPDTRRLKNTASAVDAPSLTFPWSTSGGENGPLFGQPG